jgi:hypothetical protein
LSPLFETETYTYCRNDRVKLEKPTENRRLAFHCRGCFVTWYRKHCLVCDRETPPRSPDERYPTRNFCSRKCRNAFRANPDIFQAFGVPTGRKAAAAQRQAVRSSLGGGLAQTSQDVTPKPAGPHEMGVSAGVPERSSVALWPDRQGRWWRWEQEGPDDWLLYRRDGGLAVHLYRQSSGWRVVHPRVAPDIVEPNLDAAKARAQSIALAALPLHPATRRDNAKANRLPSGAHLLDLQQRKTAPAEVLDAARFTVPLNLFGGHRFPGAPELDREIRKAIAGAGIDRPRIAPETSAVDAVQSAREVPDAIPQFLDRRR